MPGREGREERECEVSRERFVENMVLRPDEEGETNGLPSGKESSRQRDQPSSGSAVGSCRG